MRKGKLVIDARTRTTRPGITPELQLIAPLSFEFDTATHSEVVAIIGTDQEALFDGIVELVCSYQLSRWFESNELMPADQKNKLNELIERLTEFSDYLNNRLDEQTKVHLNWMAIKRITSEHPNIQDVMSAFDSLKPAEQTDERLESIAADLAPKEVGRRDQPLFDNNPLDELAEALRKNVTLARLTLWTIKDGRRGRPRMNAQNELCIELAILLHSEGREVDERPHGPLCLILEVALRATGQTQLNSSKKAALENARRIVRTCWKRIQKAIPELRTPPRKKVRKNF